MNENLIRTIAMEVVNQSIIGNYKTYLLIVCISIIAGSATAFIASYLKYRGKQYATKADFEQILNQLKQTTKVTEDIKSDINAKSQDHNNLKILAREKLESIMSQSFELELWLEKARSSALNAKPPDISESPIAKIEMYQAIYFKEVKNEVLALQIVYHPMVEFILDLAVNSINGNVHMDTNDLKELHVPIIEALSQLRAALIDKYAEKIGL